MCSISHLKDTDGQIKQNATIGFLEEEEREVLFDEEKKIRASLYKILLFLYVSNAIKSGELNLKYSYRYKAIHEYLIDEDTWLKNRDQILKSAQLENFSDYTKIMGQLKQCLEEKYTVVNQRFLEGRNPYLSINEKGRVLVKTPALEDKDTEYIAALLEQAGYIPVFQILSDIENALPLTECFTHHSVKHVKQRPAFEAFFAGIIGLGCNIGIRKMAQISVGIKENTLLNTVNWYLSLKNLHSANQRIVDLIIKLTLSTDTHGFTEIVFATTHFLDVAFAPRIKKIGKQRIYAFSAPDTYEKRGYKILPSRVINQKLIAKHWDDILRFMATIKLKQVTASQLFKRLSSYAKDHPLYQALKEFGRITKSIFILTYFDDVKLRQRIEK